MKVIDMPRHPGVTYWTCPEDGAVVVIGGPTFSVVAAMGFAVETEDLAAVLPMSELEAAESLVEKHEHALHGGPS